MEAGLWCEVEEPMPPAAESGAETGGSSSSTEPGSSRSLSLRARAATLTAWESAGASSGDETADTRGGSGLGVGRDGVAIRSVEGKRRPADSADLLGIEALAVSGRGI